MTGPDDLLADLVQQLPIGVFALDEAGRVLLWNPCAERLTGWHRDALLGRELRAAPLDAAGTERIMDELGRGLPFTGRFPVLDGGGLSLRLRAVPCARPGIAVVGVLQETEGSGAGEEAIALLDALWESAPVGLAYFDTALRYRRINGAVIDVDGGTADQRLGRTLEEVHGDTGAIIAEGLREVLEDGRPRVDVPVGGRLWHGEGPPREWRMNMYPVPSPEGGLLGVGIVTTGVTPTEATRQEPGRAAQREDALNRYQSLIEATSAAVWVREVDGSALRDAPGLRAITGQSVEEMRGWGFLDAVHPSQRDAWRAAWERAVAAEPAEVFTQVYRLRSAAGGYRWFRTRAAPVRSDGRVSQWVGTETDIDDAMRARDRLDVLAQATFAMNAAVEPDGELVALADALVPEFADVCRVYLVDPPTGAGTVTGRRSVVRTAPGVPESPMSESRFVFGPDHPIARCVRERAPVLADLSSTDTRRWHPTTRMEQWGADVAAHSVLVAPVLSGGSVVAVLLLVGCADRPRFTEDDLGLLAELGVRASAAVEKAVAFQQSRQVAVALQSAMLTRPPEVPGYRIEARYLPAAAGLAVGGDWFDAFLLPGGDLAVGVGDVAGHDLLAATTMGQLRSMLRALADGSGPPSAAVTGLDRVATRLAVTYFTTLVHGHLARVAGEQAGAVFRWCNAGHPPPVLVAPGGEPRFLGGEVGIVLGVAPGSVRGDSEVALPVGSTLLLYTDGLVERRHDPEDRAAGELLALVRAHAHRPLGDFCDHLVRDTAADTDDDIVVLAVRVS